LAALFGGSVTTTLAGCVITGAVVSMTVMTCESLDELPAASVAVNVRVMTRGLAGVPAPPLFTSETLNEVAPPQLSEADASDAFAPGTLATHW
jgi:hypothetical protein